MPSSALPYVPPYQAAPPTNQPLDYADLPIIDLSKANTVSGRLELSTLVHKAMTTQGFFYVVNYGLDTAQATRMFDIADVPFSAVSDEEKKTYEGQMKLTGSYQGYKLRQYWHIDNGVHDQVENYNINHDVSKKAHPQALRPLLPEIHEFSKFTHFNVLQPLLRLFALGLDLSEETLVDLHGWDAVNETYVRFMKYHPRSAADEEKTQNVWLKGHTDFGSVTILYSQPVAALQILTEPVRGTRQWKWVKHIENALVINAGDMLNFLSGGLYRATIHRVVQPPVDQRGHTRLGIFYFVMPNDGVLLKPLPGLPGSEGTSADVPTVEAWRKGRTSAYGQSQLKKGADAGVEEEVINGLLVKHYN